jgi:hypothetical protein
MQVAEVVELVLMQGQELVELEVQEVEVLVVMVLEQLLEQQELLI